MMMMMMICAKIRLSRISAKIFVQPAEFSKKIRLRGLTQTDVQYVNYQLSHVEYSQYKNSFITRCLFNFR